MFKKGKLHLPENICFTNTGLLLYYNIYEIASYADGARKLVLLCTEGEKFLNAK
jgi:hypothetical protein